MDNFTRVGYTLQLLIINFFIWFVVCLEFSR